MRGGRVTLVGRRLAVMAVLLTACAAKARTDTQKVVAGPQFDKGGFWRFWFGDGYRRAWITPVELPVLDLEREAAGLTPVRQVGGLQSVGLALAGADGRAYTFRKIVKEPERILPAAWRESATAAVVSDQTAGAHPAASAIIASLARSVGILFYRSRLVVMPDDARLGPFHEVFAGAVGTLDEYPTPGYEGITEIVSSSGLWQQWRRGDRVDSRSFLKARLFDLVVGNWDRHHGQWRWARLPGRPLWVPLPEDPDQAFTRYAGVAVSAARRIQPRLMNYSGDYPKSLEGLTANNADVTRWLLADVELPVYQEVARELQQQMTDAVIDEAMRQMPPAWYAIDGAELAAQVRRRRDHLAAFTRRFYLHLADGVDVRGTDGDDLATIRHQPDGSLEVSLTPAGTTGSTGPAYFHRRFSPEETQEVRIYLLGGNDQLVTNGPRKGEIEVRVLGGGGDDRLDDSLGGGAELWDSEGTNVLSRGPGTLLRTAAWTNPTPDPVRPWFEPRGYGHWTSPLLMGWWEPDQDVMIGGGLTRTGWGFRKYPWSSLQTLTLIYSTGYQSLRGAYSGQFRLSDSAVLARLDLFASGAEDLNYYGLGNETPYSDKSVAKSQEDTLSVFPSLRIQPSGVLEVYLGAEAKHLSPHHAPEKRLDQEEPYGSSSFGEVLLRGGLNWDSRGRSLGLTAQRALLSPGALPPEKVNGVHLAFDAFYAPRAWDAATPFGGIEGSLSGFVGNEKVVFAARGGGRTLWGRYPWFESARIGGSDNVRGWDTDRFRGDSSLYGNAELRVWLGRRRAPILPLRWGLFSFLESGRVWYAGESSESWHTGGGAGAMTQVVGVPLTLSGSVAWGDADKGLSVYVRGGYSF